MIPVPEAYQGHIKGLLEEEFPAYLDSFQKTYGQTLRVNRLKVEPADMIRRFLLRDQHAAIRPVPWCENGFYYEGEERLSQTPWYYAGLYYLQEPSAMAPAAFLPVRPGDRVLDLCAAPGGKSTALASALSGQGLLVANDISASRCQALLKNLEMAGVPNMLITCESPERLAGRFAGWFDCVLADVPCSGEGMFRRQPDMMKKWSRKEAEAFVPVQKEIIEAAADMVRPGGYLLYSTCTFSPEENEQIIYDFLRLRRDFNLVETGAGKEGGPDRGRPDWVVIKDHDREEDEEIRQSLDRCRRFWFHKVEGEGQFAALLQKDGPDTLKLKPDSHEMRPDRPGMESARSGMGPDRPGMESARSGMRPDRPGRVSSGGPEYPGCSREAADFLAECDLKRLYPESGILNIMNLKGRIYLLPPSCPDLSGLRVIRSGLLLGEEKKNRFEPSQALAMALRRRDYPRTVSFKPDDADLDKYLKGETLSVCAPDGWVLVCLEDYPLGWGKCQGGKLKNKYNKGWRKRS